MIPQQGQNITIIFRNGIQLDGEVISWSDIKSVLKPLSGGSTIVIQKSSEDILFYKLTNAKIEYEVLKEKPNKNLEDLKTIAELKTELNTIEKLEVKEKLNTHIPNNFREISYGLPTNVKIKSPIEHTGTQAPRSNSVIDTELQSLFSKKH